MSKICKVCNQPAFGVHFGAMTCRACAMFFRRKIQQKTAANLKKCKAKCRIEDFRKLCPTCRFKNCLEAGMKDTVSAPTPFSKPPITFQLGPIISSFQKGYQNLESARKLAFGLKDKKTPQASTYTIQNNVIAIDFKLIISHLISECVTFQALKKPEQKTLLAQFIAPFHILESTFKAEEPDLVMLANGDYIDHKGLDRYYKDLFDLQHQQAFRVFKPYWDLQHRIIRSALDENNLDLTEFLFLVALMLWDIDFHECSESLVSICLDQKTKIMKELCDYEKHRESVGELEEDRSLRVGKIMMMLQGMQRTLNMLYESHEVSQFYHLDTLHDTFFDLLRGY